MATGLTTAELTQIKSQLEAIFLPDTCTILTPTQAIGSAGDVTQTWGTATASVACRLDSIKGAYSNVVGGQETTTAGGIQPYHQYVLTLPYSATITTSHRVVHSSINYNVTSVSKDGSWLLCKRAIVERVNE